jgi:hypothetical protein
VTGRVRVDASKPDATAAGKHQACPMSLLPPHLARPPIAGDDYGEAVALTHDGVAVRGQSELASIPLDD